MVNPQVLCRKHLQGEHGELHKFLPSWLKRHRIAGRVRGNQIEPLAYKARHDALAAEMLRRGYTHKSPLEQPDFSYLSESEQNAKVDVLSAQAVLCARCAECHERMEMLERSKYNVD